jgi:DNA-binding transcriptional ArsR family regulator
VNGQTMRGVAELEELDRVFGALAHQTRRAILSVLHANGSVLTSGAIAARFDCSWPTTSRHLRVLEEAGLVQALLRGRERVYQLQTDQLRTLTSGWIDRFAEEEAAEELPGKGRPGPT